MKAYLLGGLISILISFSTTAGWYFLFGYTQSKPLQESLISIFTSPNFWLGVGIWSLLYFIFFVFPIVFVGHSKREKLTEN